MTADVLPLRRGSGRQSAAAEAAFDAQLELAAHCDEALRFVERARSHARQVEHASRGERPDIHRHAVSLLGLLTGYERRHVDDDEPAEVAA